MNATLLGIFSNRLNAENAIADLANEGFDARDISLVMKGDKETKIGGHGTNIAEGAASGVVTGGVLGGLAGFLIGLGAISLPGVGALLVAGPIAAAIGLAGAAATTVSGALTGALAGGIVGALVGLGLPEEEAKMYESRVKEGGILIAVPVFSSEEEKARHILAKHGADMIRSIGAARHEYPRPYESYPQYDSSPRQYPESRDDTEKKPIYDERYYDPDRYSSPVYYSEVRPRRKSDTVTQDYPEDGFAEPERDYDISDEERRKTANSLKEKLKKLFS